MTGLLAAPARYMRRLVHRFSSPMAMAIAITIAVVAWVLSEQIGARDANHQAGAVPVPARNEPEPPQVRVRWIEAEAKQGLLVLHGHTEGARRVELRIETAGRVATL